MMPRFAVVGHPNKGKSSIVSTLAEDAAVAVAPIPGTTTASRTFPMRIDGETLYELIDTPGFQRPREVLAWLHEQSAAAADRAAAVARFVETHTGDPRFHDECELLRPIIDGAGILYVVDGSRPYGAEYEPEMEILRWTGRPRMALINLIADGDHIDEWRRALDQYFSIVRVFDAVHADVNKRFTLLRSFGELHPPWQAPIARAVSALEDDYRQRRERAARAIASLIIDALTMQQSERIGEDADPAPVIAKAEARLRQGLANREQKVRKEIESIYRHAGAVWANGAPAIIDSDLFSSESAQLFGLSRTQLVATGAMSGAVAGGAIDIALGGASLFAVTGISALVGGLSALFGGDQLGKAKVLGQSLGSREITVGPFRDANLPWILLGRALLHHEAIAELNHARRDAIVMAVADGAHRANAIEPSLRKRLGAEFDRLRRDGTSPNDTRLEALVAELLLGQQNLAIADVQTPETGT